MVLNLTSYYFLYLEELELIKFSKMATVYSNDIKKVLISDDVNEKCVQILENNDLVVVKNTKLSVEQLKEEIKVYNKKK